MKTVNYPGEAPREFSYDGTPYTLKPGESEWPDDIAAYLQQRMKAQGVRIVWGDEQKGEKPELPEGRELRREALENAKVRSEAAEKERGAPKLPSEIRADRAAAAARADAEAAEAAEKQAAKDAEEAAARLEAEKQADADRLAKAIADAQKTAGGDPATKTESNAPEAQPEHPAEALVSEPPAPEHPAEQEEGRGSTAT